MVFITECDFCGKKQDLSRNITLSFCCIKGKQFTLCDNEKCNNLFANSKCIHELNVNYFTQYSINGNVNDINIIRSNGTTSKGNIKKFEGFDSNICIKNKNIHFYLEFLDNNNKSLCKIVAFNILASVNMHLPIITIYKSDRLDNITKEKLKKYQEELDNYCILNNKATRIMLISYVKNDGLFSILPKELFSIILKNYYELD